jgi:hypothetical protein
MKKNIILAIILLCYQTIDAQSLRISVGGLYSLPLGDLKKTEIENLNSGFASPGMGGFINGTYQLKSKLMVGLLISSSNYQTKDAKKIATSFLEAYEVEEVSLKSNSWTISHVLPTIGYKIMDKKLDVEIMALFGASRVKSHLLESTIEEAVITQNEGTGISLTYGLNMMASYPIYKKLSLSFTINYIYTNPNINIKTEGYKNPVDGLFVRKIYDGKIPLLNTGLGISYDF